MQRKMIFNRVAFLSLVAGMVSARIREDESEGCPQLESDWRDKLDTIFKRLPREIRGIAFENNNTEPIREAYPGLFLSTDIIQGLDNLQPYRPYQTFCRDKERIILFNVGTDLFIRYYLKWKLCSGHNGTASALVLRSRYEGQIGVTRTGDRTEWKVFSIDATTQDGVHFALTGLGETVKKAVAWVGWAFSGTFGLEWTHIARKALGRVIEETAQNQNIRFGRPVAV